MNQNLTKYKSFKNIIEIIENGDIKDPRYKLIIRSLTVEQVMEMKKFIQFMEYNQEVNQLLKNELN
jgi:hypothetical protein